MTDWHDDVDDDVMENFESRPECSKSLRKYDKKEPKGEQWRVS